MSHPDPERLHIFFPCPYCGEKAAFRDVREEDVVTHTGCLFGPLLDLFAILYPHSVDRPIYKCLNCNARWHG